MSSSGDDKASRDQILLFHREEILDDIERVLVESTHPQVVSLSAAALEALSAARAGLSGPCQAFCAAILTSILEDHYGYPSHADARRRFERETLATAGLSSQRRVVVQQALVKAFLNSAHLPDPDVFNRHVTVHSISDSQLSEANSLTALMLVAGAVRELQEVYLVSERGFAVTPRFERFQVPVPISAA
jgi:hypothetical protein